MIVKLGNLGEYLSSSVVNTVHVNGPAPPLILMKNRSILNRWQAIIWTNNDILNQYQTLLYIDSLVQKRWKLHY